MLNCDGSCCDIFKQNVQNRGLHDISVNQRPKTQPKKHSFSFFSKIHLFHILIQSNFIRKYIYNNAVKVPDFY